MSCNCIGNVYTNDNGESVPLTEYMCFDIIANNPFCCDNFNSSCLDRIYFDSTASTYIGCHNCPSSDAKCCQKIQTEANKLNPDKNSKCCENFDSFCVEAYETLKNSSGNFCSDRTDLVNFYKEVYSTDYRPCGFDDEKAEQCIQDLKCYEYDSEECKDKIYQKIQDYNSPCHCTCLKQAGYIDSCMLHVIHKEPTCCHSWTAECDQIKEELSKTFGNPCTIATQDPNAIALLVGVDPGTPDTVINCGCTIKGLPTFDDVPCCFKESCEYLNSIYSGIFEFDCNDLGKFLNELANNSIVTDCQPTDYPLAGGPPCPNPNCNDCDYQIPTPSGNGWLSDPDSSCPGTDCPKWPWGAIEGCNVKGEDATDSVLGTPPRNPPDSGPIYPIYHNHNSCALSYAQQIWSYGCQGIFDQNELQDFILNLAKRFANPTQEIQVQATNCTECCSICRYFGKEADECPGVNCDNFSFTPETPDSNNDDYLVYEGQGITFTVGGILTNYLYYELINSSDQNFINKDDIGPSGFGFNGIPLGMTGLLQAVGNEVTFNLKFKSDGIFDSPEFFRVKLTERSEIDGCEYPTFISNPFEVREPATYTLLNNYSCAYNEGSTFSLTINTTNVNNGTPIYYRIVPVTGTIVAADFNQPTGLTGSRQVNNGSMVLNFDIKNDTLTEGSEKFRVQFSDTSNFTNIIATTNSGCSNGITINDTSTTALTMSVTANGQGGNPLFPNEGDGITFAVTSNQTGTFYYTIDTIAGSIQSSDFEATTTPLANTLLADSFSITSLSPPTKIHKKLRQDLTTENPSDVFKLSVRTVSTSGNVQATSPDIFVTDSSQATSITLKAVVDGTVYSSGTNFTVQEDKVIRFEITSNNTGTFEYLIESSNFTAADLIADSTTTPQANIELTEDINLIANQLFVVNKRIKKDDITETESFVFKIQNSAGTLTVSTGTISISDVPISVTVKANTSSNNITVNEGALVTFDITSNYNGNYQYEILGTAEQDDFIADSNVSPAADISLSGIFAVNSGLGKVNKKIKLDGITDDPNDAFQLKVYRQGIELASSPTVTISDTSQTVFYEITGPTAVQEGINYNYTVNTTNSAYSTLYYRIKANGTSNITAADFSTALTGSFTVSTSGSSSVNIAVNVAQDSASEVDEYFDIEIWPNATFTGTRLAVQQAIKITDVTSSATITHLSNVVEGRGITFLVRANNVQASFLQYQIEETAGDITANDFNPASLSGSFNLTTYPGYKEGTLTLTTVNNSTVETQDAFKVDIYNPFNGIFLTSSSPVTIQDAAPTFTYVNPTDTFIQEGESISYIVNTTNYSGPLYYRLAYVSDGILTTDDFNPLSGAITITNNTGTLTLTSLYSAQYRGNRVFRPLFSQTSDGPEITATGVPSNAVLSDANAVYNITDYPTSVVEGNQFDFTVETENVSPNTTVYYRLNGLSASDVTGGITGPLILTGNPASRTKTIITVNNSQFEGTESFVIEIYNNSSFSGSALVVSNTIQLLEGPKEYNLDPNGITLVEGSHQNFVLNTQNVQDSTLYYKIIPTTGSGIVNSDFDPPVLSGSFNIVSNSGSFGLTAAINAPVETNDLFRIGIYSNSTLTDEVYRSAINRLKDSNPLYNISPNKLFVSEGDGVTFTVTTSNVSNGTTLIYSISGTVDKFDFIPVGITGLMTITNNFYQFYLGISSDLSTEGQETFTAVIKQNDAGGNLSDPTDTITIDDTSVTYYEISPTDGDITEGNSQSYTVTRFGSGSNTTLYYGITGIKGGVEIKETDFVDGLTGEFNLISGSGTFNLQTIRDDIVSDRSFIVKVGTTNNPYTSTIVSSGQFNIIDLIQSYALTTTTDSIVEGQSGVTFTLTTQNVPNGTIVNYVIESSNTALYNITANDFEDGLLQGSITINNNSAQLFKRAISDGVYEGTEKFKITFRVNGEVVVPPKEITIIDSLPSFASITPNSGNVREGDTTTFTVVGSNINPATPYTAILDKSFPSSSFSAEDVNPIQQTIYFTNNQSQFSVNFLTTGENTLFEGNDFFKVRIRQFGSTSNLLSSDEFKILNANPSGTVQPSVTTISEGGEITFNIFVSNVPDGSTLTYQILGISAEDLVDNQLTGSFQVTQSGNQYTASVTKRLSTDSVYDEEESLEFVIYYNSNELARTNPIAITDSSQPPIYDFSINRQVLVSLSALKATLTPQNTPPGTVFRMKLLPNIGTTDVPDNAFQDKNGNPLATSLDFTYDGSTPIEAVWILNTLEVFQFRIHVFYVGSGLVSGQETEIKISDVCYSFGDPSINEVVFTCPGSILCGVQQDGTLSGGQDGPGEIKDCESDNCPLEYILYECGCSCSEYGGTQTCTICKPKCLDNTVPSGEILCLNCEWIYYKPQPTTCPDGSPGVCIAKGAQGVDCPEACSTDTPSGACLCAGCDQNPGYTTYTSTPEVFLAIYHDPFVRQAKEGSAEDPCNDFCDAQYGGCSTCSQDSYPCMWGAGGCECSPGEEVCFCFRAKSHGYVSYSRFVTRKFRYDPDGFDNTSILVTDEEKVRYRGNTIRVNSRIGQDNCRSCCNSSLCGGGGDTEKGMAVGCVIKTDNPFFYVNNCYGRNFDPDVFPGELITDTIRDSAIVYQSNIFAGIESKYLGYLDDPEDTEALIQTPQAEFYGSECVTETQITKCETQGYIYGKPFPEEGIPGLSGVSALFDAPHKYDLFTSECCEMLSSCTSTQGGGACSTSFDNNCSDFMTNSCFEKANTYCIHSGCDLLQDQNRSKEPFVFYYQGINPEDNPDSPYNLTDCFKIYGLTLKGDVGDPIFYGGTFIDTFSYPPFLRYTIPGSGTVPAIPLRSTNPPQYSGTCLNKSGDTQFEAIKFISEISQPGNPSRTEVIKYLKNVIRLDISDLVTDCFCSKMDYVTPPNTGYNPHPYASEEFSTNGGRPLSCRYASIIEASIENITSDGSQLPVPFDALKGEAIPECGVIFSFFWPPQYQFGIVDSAGTVCTSDPETYSNSFNLINYKATNNLFPINTIAIYNVNSADIINPSTGQLQDNIFRNPCNPCGSFFSPFYYNYDPGSQSTSGGFYINYDAGKNFEPLIEFLSFSAYNYYGTPEEGAFAKIAYSRTLAQQIAAGRIYNHLVCQFIQAVLFAGIEVLHITEPDKGIYDYFEQLTEPAERLEVAQLYNDGPGFPPSVGQLGRYPIGRGLPLDPTNMRYPNSESVRLSTEDKFGVCGLSVTPFNINIGISRKMIPTNKLNLPNCSIKVYDKDDNEVDCNGINEIIMGGRCFSGPVISKEVWERMKVKWPFVYGYTPTGSFGEWVNSVPNFDVVNSQSGFTIRQEFYKILKDSLYDLPSGPAPYVNEEIVHSDEERYLEFDINAKENPYITLEDLQSRIPFEACYDIPVAPTSDTLPCFSTINSLFGAEGGSFEQLLNAVALSAGCELSASDPICQANTTSCISAMVGEINNVVPGCINQTQLGNILQQFCDADPKNNPCFFKYNNKIYREKQL